MNFDLDDLKPLADVLLINGVPLLANMFLPGIGGTIASAIVPSIASAFGLTSSASVSDLTTAIQADPNSAAKLAVIQAKHAELLDFAQKSITADQNALTLEPSFWGRMFVGGWRPAMGWIGVVIVSYQTFATLVKISLLPADMFSTILTLWAALAGVRTIETVAGTARTSLTARKTKTK
jgi:hypothetical protein